MKVAAQRTLRWGDYSGFFHGSNATTECLFRICQDSADFFYKGPNSTYSRLCRPRAVSATPQATFLPKDWIVFFYTLHFKMWKLFLANRLYQNQQGAWSTRGLHFAPGIGICASMYFISKNRLMLCIQILIPLLKPTIYYEHFLRISYLAIPLLCCIIFSHKKCTTCCVVFYLSLCFCIMAR